MQIENNYTLISCLEFNTFFIKDVKKGITYFLSPLLRPQQM
jgi:hypothetical protein